MGAVFKAQHVRLKRLVAVKVLLGDRLHDESAVARFDREMEAVGKLDHPNIVRATDAGEDDDTHYLVMELVDGPNLSQLSKSLGPINVADACELVRQAAAGLQHAHEHGLVHRDIKPSNLILADAGSRKATGNALDNSGNATVKILDLGLALLRENPTTEGELTSSGQVMGTLDYMAPEQASDTHSVDIRADIYSLGCTLYHLLAGSAPFTGSQYSTILKKMMAHAKSPVPPLSEVRSDIPEELSVILNQMLAKEPAERFSTPGEILAALQPFVGDADLPALLNRYRAAHKSVEHLDTQLQSTITPVSSALSDTIDPVAQPKSASNPTPKVQTDSNLASEPFAPTIIVDAPPQSFANRNGGRGSRRRTWQLLAAIGGVLLFGIVFFVGTGEGRVELTVNHPDVTVSVDGEPQQLRIMDGANGEYRVELPNIPAGRRELIVSRDGFATETKHFWITRNGSRAFEMKLASESSLNSQQSSDSTLADAKPGVVDPSSQVVSNLGPAENILPGLIPRPASIPGIKRWNIESKAIRTSVHRIAYSLDGKLLACGENYGRVRLYDVATNELVNVLSTRSSTIFSLAWSPDGQMLAIGFHGTGIQVWSRSGQLLSEHKTLGTPFAISWAQDSSQFAVADNSPLVMIISRDGSATHRVDTGHSLGFLTFAGQALVAGSKGGSLIFLNPSDWSIIRTVDAHEAAITTLAWNPQAKVIASGDLEGRVVFTRPDGAIVATHREHVGVVYSLACHPEGTSFVSVDPSENIIHWDPLGNVLRTIQSPAGSVPTAIAWNPDGHTYSVTGNSNNVVHVSADDDQTVSSIDGHELRVTDIEWNRSGTRFAMGDRDSVLHVFASDLEESLFIKTPTDIHGVAWSPDEDQIATANRDWTVRLWNLSTRREAAILNPLGHNNLYSLNWSLDSDRLAATSGSGTTTIWNVSEPDSAVQRNHSGRVEHVEWVPGSNVFVTGGVGNGVEFGEPGKAVLKVEAAKDGIKALACSPNGNRIAAISDYCAVDVWDIEGGRISSTEPYPGSHLFSEALAWAGDSGTLFALRSDGRLVRLSEQGEILAEVPLHHSLPWKIAVHPEEDIALSCDETGSVIKWSTKTLDPEWVLVTMPEGESLQFSASGDLLRGDRELFEREFVYVIEDETGRRHLLTPSEFEHRRSLPGDFSVSDEHAAQSLVKWVHDRGGKVFNNGVPIQGPLKPGQQLSWIRILLTGDEIDDESIRDLVERIPQSIRKFDLEMTDVAATSSCFEVLSTVPVLHELVMRGTKIDPRQIANLKHATLEQFSLIDVDLTEAANGQFDWSGLPNVQQLQLHTRNGAPVFHFDDDSLRQMASSFKRLNTLMLGQTTITDDGLDVLKSHSILERLQLPESFVSDRGIAAVVKNHPLLIELMLGNSLMTGTAIDDLSNLKNLTVLSIPNCSRIDSKGFSKLSSLTNLERLNVTSTEFGDVDIESVCKLPKLSHFSANYTKLTDKGLNDLARLRTLQSITVSGTSVTAEGIAKLKIRLPDCTIQSDYTDEQIRAALGPEDRNRLFAQWVLDRDGIVTEMYDSNPRLDSVDAIATNEHSLRIDFSGRSDFTDGDLATLHQIRPSLRLEFRLDGTSITSKGVQSLNGLNLTGLDVSGTRVSDGAFSTATSFTNLVLLDLSDTQVTSASFKYFSKLPKLKLLLLANLKIDAADLMDLRHPRLTQLAMAGSVIEDGKTDFVEGLPNLEGLDLDAGASLFSDDSLKQVGTLAKLSHLRLKYTQITDDGLDHLFGLRKLHELQIVESRISDDGLAKIIKNWPELRGLSLDYSVITDDGLTQLPGLKQLKMFAGSGCGRIGAKGFSAIARVSSLEHLNLFRTSLTDDDVQTLSALKLLNHLNIANNKVTDGCVDSLLEFPSLKVLDIQGTAITAEGVTRLRAGLPNCDIRAE